MSIDNATPEDWDAIVQAHHAGVVAQSDDKSDHLLRRLNAALEKPFGEVPIYWRCLAFAMWQEGYRIERSTTGAAWSRIPTPQWNPNSLYRIAEKPEELVLPSIDWSHVAPEWRWLVQNPGGYGSLTSARPSPSCSEWVEGCNYSDASGFASFRRGKGDWRKLIVQRPEGA
ncbi:hypothetical protein [Paraburkholderia tropica]|uniref:hypothetical protein n=1 Tax=Paraburkholderia tropica TaxID=92647 RepID=UPI001F1D1A10|nr:hypothetical protein [Paraburkholderia tropica]